MASEYVFVEEWDVDAPRAGVLTHWPMVVRIRIGGPLPTLQWRRMGRPSWAGSHAKGSRARCRMCWRQPLDSPGSIVRTHSKQKYKAIFGNHVDGHLTWRQRTRSVRFSRVR